MGFVVVFIKENNAFKMVFFLLSRLVADIFFFNSLL